MAKTEQKPTEMEREFIEVRESIEHAHPELVESYTDFVCRYKEFLKSYRRFLGLPEPQQGEVKAENRWNP